MTKASQRGLKFSMISIGDVVCFIDGDGRPHHALCEGIWRDYLDLVYVTKRDSGYLSVPPFRRYAPQMVRETGVCKKNEWRHHGGLGRFWEKTRA